MTNRRKPEAPKPVRKPDIGVSTGTTRSKSLVPSQSTTRDSQSSRSIIASLTPPSRSKAISKLVVPSSNTRSKAIREIDPTTHTRSFFSKKGIVGSSSQGRASVEAISSGVTRSKSIDRSINPSDIRNAVGEPKSFPPRRPLRFSEL